MENVEIALEEAVARSRSGQKIFHVRHWIGPYVLCFKTFNSQDIQIFKEIPSWTWIAQEKAYKCHYLDMPILEALALNNGYRVFYNFGLVEKFKKLKEDYTLRRKIKDIPVVEIPLLKRPLRQYQTIGSQFMYMSKKVLNADGMGSGKSAQTIGAIMLNKISDRPHKTLIIAPSSVKGSWYNEIQTMTDALQPMIMDSNMDKRFQQYMSLSDKDVLIMSYDSLIKDYTEICNYFKPDILVIDECFPGSEKVMTKTGPMRIKDIYYKYQQRPIYALSYNIENKSFEFKRVTYAWERPMKDLVQVIMTNGAVKCTPDHEFLTPQGYIKAIDLRPGMALVGNEFTKVISVRRDPVQVAGSLYDIEVEDNHNFMISNLDGNGVFVHNCHRISNRKNKITQVLIGGAEIRKTFIDIASPHSIYLLTGTPITNRLEDVYSIMKLIDPGIFSWTGFSNRYTIVEQATRWMKSGGVRRSHTYPVFVGYRNEKELKGKLSLHMIRRTKDEILPELPEKIYKTLDIELSPDERKIYNELRRDFRSQVAGKTITIATKLEFVTRAQQICNSLATLPGCPIKKSSKLEELAEVLEAEAPKRKIIIFSKFKTMTTQICETFEKFHPLHLNGEVPSEERTEMIKKFQTDDKYRLFVSTFGAGGVGITLTAADLVILYDMAYTPAMNSQSVDRAHRIGQKNSVNILVFRVKDSIEERIYEINMNKQGIIDNMISDERSVLARLGENNLDELI